MKRLFSAIIISSLLFCALADSFNFEYIGNSPQNREVTTNQGVGYSITFTNQWTEDNHPFRYPNFDPHWSRFVYASHSSDYVMWQDGGTATQGIENVAEIGFIATLQGEIGVQQNMGNVLDEVVGSGIGTAFEGAMSIPGEHLCADASHPYVSGISMIAPSPDWFSGVYNLPLWDKNTMTWNRKIEVYVYAWDAGTEEGDNYRLSNAATSPQGQISAFVAGDTADAVFVSEAGGDLQVLPVGILTFELRESSEKCMTLEPSQDPSAIPSRSPSFSPSASPSFSPHDVLPSNPVDSETDPTDTYFVKVRGRGPLRERDCNWASRGGRRCGIQVRGADGEKLGIRIRDQCPKACGMT